MKEYCNLDFNHNYIQSWNLIKKSSQESNLEMGIDQPFHFIPTPNNPHPFIHKQRLKRRIIPLVFA